MKLKFSLLLILIITIKFSISAQTLTVATYNLRYDNRGDSGNLWVNRAPIQSNLIRFHDFDVVGIQEGLINQLEDLSKSLPQYTRYGIGRDDGKAAGEHSAIYYKKDKFKLLKRGDFWLSQTPINLVRDGMPLAVIEFALGFSCRILPVRKYFTF